MADVSNFKHMGAKMFLLNLWPECEHLVERFQATLLYKWYEDWFPLIFLWSHLIRTPPPFPFPLLPLQLRLEERDLLRGSFFMKHFLKIFAPAVLDALKVIKWEKFLASLTGLIWHFRPDQYCKGYRVKLHLFQKST